MKKNVTWNEIYERLKAITDKGYCNYYVINLRVNLSNKVSYHLINIQ